MSRKAVTYARVSSRAQANDGNGLASQEKRCRDHAKAKGLEVVASFSDTISGGVDYAERPGMTSLLVFLDAQPHENFVVVFDDPKRFARSVRFHLELREALRQRGAQVECLNFNFEDDNPEGEFIETIIAAQGELERKQNGRQVSQKMEARMQSGYWVHDAPIGLKYTPVKGRGKMLVRDEPLASIITEAIEGYASRRFETQAEVKRFFESFPEFPRNRRGEIKQQRVTTVLTQPIYAGYICSERYGITWLKAQHEPLISLETYEKVQERRAGKAKAPKRKNIGDHFALRGVVACACCEAPLRSSFTRGNGGTYAYYLCQTKGCEAYGKSIRRDKLEGEVGDIIKTLQPTQPLMALATAMFRSVWDARVEQAKSKKKAAAAELKRLDQRIKALMDRILSAQSESVIPLYEGEIVALERGKAVLVEQMEKTEEPAGNFEEKLEPVLTFLANPFKLWESGHIELRRTVLKLAIADRVLYCRNEGARTTKIALPFKALEALDGAHMRSGAGGGTRTRTGTRPNRF
ncbi:MAG: hypothetical protein Gyms2KO_44790 [Gymnodinialimonas sp.]